MLIPIDDDVFLHSDTQVFGTLVDVISFAIFSAAADNFQNQIRDCAGHALAWAGALEVHGQIGNSLVFSVDRNPRLTEDAIDPAAMRQFVGYESVTEFLVQVGVLVAVRAHSL